MWDGLGPAALGSTLTVWVVYRFVKLDAPAIIKLKTLFRQSPWLAMGLIAGLAGQSNHPTIALFGTTTKTVFFVWAFSLFAIMCADTRFRIRMRFAERESLPPPSHGIMQND